MNLPDFSGLDLDFDIVDSHHHLFDLDAVYYPWLTDRPEEDFLLGDYARLKRNYSVADYRRDAAGLRVLKTVHVEAEADHDDPLRETAFLDRVMARDGVPDALVGHAWLHLPQTEEILARQAAFPQVRGIRSKPVTSRSEAARDSVRDRPASLQDPAWRRGLGLLTKYGLSWDLRVPFWHLREAAAVCGLYDGLAIVVEHCGLPWDRSEEGLSEWRAGLVALAGHPNVMLKISELGLATWPWDYRANRRIVREAIEIFGFERCMFASNFPVAGLRIGYGDQIKAIAHMVSDCSADERRALFHDTARRFYRL
jgi:predicted TIM-barrel fold metal-dependent hydrolase